VKFLHGKAFFMFDRKPFSLCLCILVIAALNLGAQQTSLSGPISGYVFEASSRSIRPIMGIPGAAYIGDAVAAGLDWAAIAPGGSSALARTGGEVYLITGLESNLSWSIVEGALPDAGRIAWSADATAAVIASSTEGRIQFIRAAAAGPAVDLPGRVSALAMGPSGDYAVVGVEAEAGGGLYLVGTEGEPRLLAAVGQAAAIALAANERDLFVADATSRQVLEIANFRQEAARMVFADEGSGISDPVGLALSRDGRLLLLANKSQRTLNAYVLATRSLWSQIELDFEPSFLEPLSRNSLFLLKAGGEASEPLLVLDASREPAVYFVPAGRGE
jgi:hypothetical protein